MPYLLSYRGGLDLNLSLETEPMTVNDSNFLCKIQLRGLLLGALPVVEELE